MRKSKSALKSMGIYIGIALLALLWMAGYQFGANSGSPGNGAAPPAMTGSAPTHNAGPQGAELHGPYRVERVVDGDTIIVRIDGTNERVRLIGVDAPESVHPDAARNTEEGKEASEYLNGLLADGIVHLEYDAAERDRYGRILAYVYDQDGNMINAALLETGYARTATYPPNVKYADLFSEIQAAAREEGAGFWGTGALGEYKYVD